MLYKINKKGIVVNEGRKGLIQKNYRPILSEINNFYLEKFNDNLLSIYVRGSVSVGRAKPFISDIDSIAILKKRAKKEILKDVFVYSAEIQKKYPFITLADMTVISLNKLLTSKEFSNLKIYLKTQSVCLYGKDILKGIPSVKPGKSLAKKMHRDIHQQLRELKAIFLGGKKQQKKYLGKDRSIEFWCIWTMRTILRFGLGIVMIKNSVYSQDLGTCLKFFSKEYPEHKENMGKALFWALNPTRNKKQISKYLNEFTPKLIGLWKKVINN